MPSRMGSCTYALRPLVLGTQKKKKVGKGDRGWHFRWLVSRSLPLRSRVQQKPGGDEGGNPAYLGEDVPGRAKSQCRHLRWELPAWLRSNEETCVSRANGGRGNPEAVTQYSREQVPMTWSKVAGVEGELGRFRVHFALCAAPGHSHCHPFLGHSCPCVGPIPLCLSLYPTLGL